MASILSFNNTLLDVLVSIPRFDDAISTGPNLKLHQNCGPKHVIAVIGENHPYVLAATWKHWQFESLAVSSLLSIIMFLAMPWSVCFTTLRLPVYWQFGTLDRICPSKNSEGKFFSSKFSISRSRVCLVVSLPCPYRYHCYRPLAKIVQSGT